jgi:hypothetical protein
MEALIVLAVMAIIAGVVVVGVSNTTKVAETTKLEQDVAALNSAVRIFKANGGKIASSWKITKVLEELKTKADATTGTKIAGLRGAVLDPRIVAIDESYEEAASGEPKALWDSVKHRFYVSKSPVRGVRRFAMDEALAEVATAERARTVNLALSDGGWVWPFQDSPSNSRNAPRSPDGSLTPDGGSGGNGSGTPLPPGGPLSLNPPIVVGAEGGTFERVDFPMVFAVDDQNPEGAALVKVSTDGQTWTEYTGPVQVLPGQTLYSYSESRDDNYWADSEVVIETYSFRKVPLHISLAFDRPAYSYGDLGGAFIGTGSPGSGANRGSITLSNPQMVPVDLMNSDSFRVQWTYDGSSPLGGNAVQGAPFSGTWVNQPVGLSHALWGGSTSSITVSAVAKSLNTDHILDSPVIKRTVPIQRMQLRAPGATMYKSRVTLTLPTQFGDTPVGTRIVFNTDGVDPGNLNGEPVAGTLYTGGEIHLPQSKVLVARAYAPSGYNNWFLVSNMVTIDGSGLSWEDDGVADEITIHYENGLDCGSLGVDTSSFIAEPGFGTTDGHSASYDDDYLTSGVDFFEVRDPSLQNISDVIPDGSTHFKLIVANADLSPAARVVINSPFVEGGVDSFVNAKTYSNIPIESLPVFSLDGVPGTTALTGLQVHYDYLVASEGGIIPTDATSVRKNEPGREEEWRGGALIIQAILVDENGDPIAPTNPALSGGGVQGVATGGLVWEAAVYLNTELPYGENPTWNPWEPTHTCPDEFCPHGNNGHGNNLDGVDVSNPGQGLGGPNGQVESYYEMNADGTFKLDANGDPIPIDDEIRGRLIEQGIQDNWLLSGYSTGYFSNPTGDANIDTNILGSEEDSYFRWGTGLGGTLDSNSSTFAGTTAITRAGVGERFLLGKFEYHNGTTLLGTDATAVDFSIDLAFLGGVVRQTFDYSFGLFSTPNDGVNEVANADYLKLNTTQSSDILDVFGTGYRMDLAFGQITGEGFSAIDEFHVFENETAIGELWGMIVRY